MPEHASPPVFDRDALLTRVHGDAALASAMAALFLDLCPQMLADVRTSVQGQDAGGLERSAHALKGSVGNFAAPAATAAAAHLELLGRSGDVTSSAAALHTLEGELDRLVPALREMLA